MHIDITNNSLTFTSSKLHHLHVGMGPGDSLVPLDNNVMHGIMHAHIYLAINSD